MRSRRAAIWLPGFEQRQERERAHWRLFLVRKRSSLKHRVHAQLLAFGHTCPVSDLFGTQGRELLERLNLRASFSGSAQTSTSLPQLTRSRRVGRALSDSCFAPATGMSWTAPASLPCAESAHDACGG